MGRTYSVHDFLFGSEPSISRSFECFHLIFQAWIFIILFQVQVLAYYLKILSYSLQKDYSSAGLSGDYPYTLKWVSVSLAAFTGIPVSLHEDQIRTLDIILDVDRPYICVEALIRILISLQHNRGEIRTRLERDSRLTITLGLNKLQSLFAIATSDEFFKNV